MKSQTFKRVLSLVLVVLMISGFAGFSAFADEGEDQAKESVENAPGTEERGVQEAPKEPADTGNTGDEGAEDRDQESGEEKVENTELADPENSGGTDEPDAIEPPDAENDPVSQIITETLGGYCVTVSGNLPMGVELHVKEVPLKDVIELLTLADDSKPVLALDIWLSLGSEKYEIPESVEVSITGIDLFGANGIEAHHILDEGGADIVRPTDYTDSSVTFTADGFSTWVLTVEQEKFVDVVVPAIWYPIDENTNQVIPGLNPIPTYPDMYPRSEVAELDEDGVYQIDYMGKPRPPEGGNSANNFMYTGNLFFTDRFHRIVAQGYSTYTVGAVSSVRKLQYGDFTDVNTTDGLHGMTKTPYQEGEIMHLYIAASLGVSLSEAEFKEEILRVVSASDETIREQLIRNIENVTYNYFGKGDSDYNSSAVLDKTKIDQIWLYKYDKDNDATGAFLMDGGEYRNFNGAGLAGLEGGKYEVVFPIYWKDQIPEYLSAPDVFSRNRYTFDDTFHFTMEYVPAYTVEVTKAVTGAALPEDFYIELSKKYEQIPTSPEPRMQLSVAAGDDFPIILSLSNAEEGSGANGVYRWTVTGLLAGTYTATEFNYKISGMDCSGTAKVTQTVSQANMQEGNDFAATFELVNNYSFPYYPPETPSPTPSEPPETEIPEESPPLNPSPDPSPDPSEDPGTDIPEETPPLGPGPGGETEIPDPETPVDAAPQTGDNSRVVPFAILSLLSAFGIAALGFLGRKKKHN